MVCASTLFIPRHGHNLDAGKMSPVTRHVGLEPRLFLRKHPGVIKVQKWKVIVTTYEHTTRGPLQDFKAFCHAIVHSPRLESIEVIIIPVGLEATIQKNPRNTRSSCDVHELLKPLITLRNVGRLTIRNADAREFPASVLEGFEPIFNSDFDCPSLEATYKPLVQGGTVVEHTFKIYHSLLAYAHAFENCITFRAEMVSIQEPFPTLDLISKMSQNL